MKEVMHCNIVHCTATQPVLDNNAMTHPIYYGNEDDAQIEIVNMNEDINNCFERVDFYSLMDKNVDRLISTEEISDYIKKELQEYDSCLVVLNTKAAVSKLYDYLEKEITDAEIIYLTTNLCAAHRLDIIKDMNYKLIQNRNNHAHYKLICISTQLIEAGVDVDFDIVFRSLAGVDSLIQCAGRCNREGKLSLDGKKMHGKVYIMRYKEENLSYIPDIKAAVDASEYAFRLLHSSKQIESDNKIMIEKLQEPYFNKYYVSNRNKLDYIDSKKRSTIVEELGKNNLDRYSYAIVNNTNPKHMMYQAFRTAAENFKLIDNDTTGIIVPYKNQELIEKLELAMNRKDNDVIKATLQKLQRYSVNVYLNPKLEGFVYNINMEYNVYIIPKEYYNGNKGIITEELADWIL